MVIAAFVPIWNRFNPECTNMAAKVDQVSKSDDGRQAKALPGIIEMMMKVMMKVMMSVAVMNMAGNNMAGSIPILYST